MSSLRSSVHIWTKLVLGLMAPLVLVGAFVGWQLVSPKGESSNKVVSFTVVQGSTVKQIALSLQQTGLIRSRFWFEAWVWFRGNETKFLAGQYELPAHANVVDLAALLTGSQPQPSELTLRFIEGWTLRQMDAYLPTSGFADSKNFISFVTSAAKFSEFTITYKSLFDGKPAGASLEGYLFPDTYRLYRDSTTSDLVRKALMNLDRKILPAWREEVSRRGYNIFQILTLASIVEREVAGDKDRAMVADIFWRRVEAGRGLEADSTINYITGKNLPAVTANDLSVDSPYNTYRYRGLPPGPISNPGESAIRAAVYPQANQYWYFLTTPDGEVIYSKTFDQHKAAKAKYLR